MARPGKAAAKRLVRALSTDVADALEDFRCVGLFGPRRESKNCGCASSVMTDRAQGATE